MKTVLRKLLNKTLTQGPPLNPRIPMHKTLLIMMEQWELSFKHRDDAIIERDVALIEARDLRLRVKQLEGELVQAKNLLNAYQDEEQVDKATGKKRPVH